MASKFGTWWQKIKVTLQVSLLRRLWRRTREKGNMLVHPAPRQGTTVPCTPAEQLQKKQHPLRLTIVIGAGLLGIALLVAFIGGYIFNWDWTGFSSYTPPAKDSNFQRAKTLWDWLPLLVIPLMLAIGGFWLNQIQKSREQRTIQQQAELEREAAEKRAQTEREIASDNQREVALQAYLDKMSELLLEKHLRESAEDDEVRKIAHVRTLMVLPRLDGDRRGSVLQFLHESDLIDKDKCIISLSGANLSEANLSRAILSGADLSRANLSRTNLNRAILSGAFLFGTNLSGTNLSGTDLRGTNLSGTNLSGADLRGTDLSRAILMDAKVTQEQ